MAQFNLADYETVEERIKRFYEAHKDGRITTQNHTTEMDRKAGTWVVFASVFLTSGDQANGLAKATGLAFEVDGQGMANKTSALENCETSAIGRALANANFSGNKRASREEMEKVQRAVGVSKVFDESKISAVKTKADARSLWVDANKAGASKATLKKIEEAGEKATS